MTETPEMSIYEKKFAKSDKTDAILVVDGKKLHVNKALLSVHSDYFDKLFNSDFKQKSMEEIQIEDVDFEDFATVLSLVHPDPLIPTTRNVEKLLELADRFLLTGAKRHLELFLMTVTLAPSYFHPNCADRLEKLRIADKYKLENLLNHTLNSFLESSDFCGLRTKAKFQNMSDYCKLRVFDRMLDILGY